MNNTTNQKSKSSRKGNEGIVVTEKGVRVSGIVHTTQESADKEIAERKKILHEKAEISQINTKQQLFG